MANLKTTYMGLELKNPIIIGASNLVKDMHILKLLEKAGASAIVYKSLFEEQIQLERLQFDEELSSFNDRNAEMLTLFPGSKHSGPEEFIMNLKKVKESLSIPVIASLNAWYFETWKEYAALIEQTGVDALELNFYSVPRKFDKTEQSIVEEQVKIVKAVTEIVKIPVGVKLSPFYTNPLFVIKKLDEAGADAFVLFNRLFQPDIDIKTQKHITPLNISHPEDNKVALRFAGLLYGNIRADICANSGIYDGDDVVKMILAGADAVQVVSTVYKNGPEQVSRMLRDLEGWMNEKNYSTLDEFRGKLSDKNVKDHFIYKRAQYIDLLMRSDELFKKHPVI